MKYKFLCYIIYVKQYKEYRMSTVNKQKSRKYM